MVLAAGASRRMGRPKALLELDGEPFVARIVRRMVAAGCDRVLVVVSEALEAAVRARVPDAVCVRNPAPEGGMLTSIHCALEAAPEAACWLVALVDHPDVAEATYRAVLDARADGCIVVPQVGGRRGHPVLWDAALRDELLAAPLDGGARVVVRRDPGRVVALDLDDAEVHRDVDLPADYDRLIAER